jgi:hypothetical protein
MIEVAVDVDLHPIAVELIAPGDAAHDFVRLTVVRANGDVKILVVVGDLEIGWL